MAIDAYARLPYSPRSTLQLLRFGVKMKFFKPYLLLSLVLPALAFAQPPSSPPGPAITFDKSSVSVAGVSPKGQAVLFGVAREISEDDVATIVRRSQVLADDDGDGVVKLDLGRDVPLRSVWVAVDLATGQVAAAAPEGYPLRRVDWRGVGIVRGNSRADRVEDARTFAEVLLVRPGAGAWQLTVGDGSERDDDGAADGKLAAALDRMTPVAGTDPPPTRFDPKDVVVLIDPNRLELTVVQAGDPKAAEVGR
jgi:hypothetical protein